MPGMKITLPTRFTVDRPVLLDDPIFSKGSLMLLDSTHALNPWPARAVRKGQYLPNLAGQYSAPLLGTDGIDADALFDAPIFGSSDGIIERTSKGALHVIPSRSGALNSGAALKYPEALKSYLVANLSHSFYFSDWRRLTRSSGSGGFPFFAGLFRVGNTSAFWHLQNSLVPSSGASSLGHSNATAGAGNMDLAEKCQSWAVKPTGSFSDFNGSSSLSAWIWGANGYLNASAAERGALPAYSLKRLYVEDLTVSGRSYAEVAAIDAALHREAVLTPGGRYYGDTHTEPTN